MTVIVKLQKLNKEKVGWIHATNAGGSSKNHGSCTENDDLCIYKTGGPDLIVSTVLTTAAALVLTTAAALVSPTAILHVFTGAIRADLPHKCAQSLGSVRSTLLTLRAAL